MTLLTHKPYSVNAVFFIPVTFNKGTKGNRQMTNFKKTAIVALLAGLGFTEASQSALIARGGGMVYDDVNKITWASDANLFQTQAASNANLVTEIIAGNGGIIHDIPNSYDTPALSGTYSLTSADFNTGTGQMTWWGAQAWSNNLTLGGVKGWSLSDTSRDIYGYFVTASQMGNLFYNQLGGENGGGLFPRPQLSTNTDLRNWYNANYDLFTNIQNYVYWSSDNRWNPHEYANYFNISIGYQSIASKNATGYAWAVHSGDVATVPVPGAVWLFLSGLMGVLSFNRRKNKTTNVIAA